jgi:hypothetical protein
MMAHRSFRRVEDHCSLESEAFVIPKSERDAVAECVQRVVLAVAASVTNGTSANASRENVVTELRNANRDALAATSTA